MGCVQECHGEKHCLSLGRKAWGLWSWEWGSSVVPKYMRQDFNCLWHCIGAKGESLLPGIQFWWEMRWPELNFACFPWPRSRMQDWAGCRTEQAVSCFRSCHSQVLSCTLIPSTPRSQTWGKVWAQNTHSIGFWVGAMCWGKGAWNLAAALSILSFISKHTVIWRPSKSAWLSYLCIWCVGFGFCLASRCFWEWGGNLSMEQGRHCKLVRKQFCSDWGLGYLWQSVVV